MVCTTLKNNYDNYKDCVTNRSVNTSKNFNSLVHDIKTMYYKLFNYSALSNIKEDLKNSILFIKEDTPLVIENWEITFNLDFQLKNNYANQFELLKYSYVMKNETQYFRFDGTHEGEHACHPYYHLHIVESGVPRIATHLVTPYDFLIFIADMTHTCPKLV